MNDDESGPQGQAIPALHRIQRSLGPLAVLAVTAALFLVGLSTPAIATAVGVTFEQGLRVVSAFSAVVALACVAFYRFGAHSRAYRFCDVFESIALGGCIAYLIWVSRGVHPFFWIFYAMHVLATAFMGFTFVYLLTVCVAPAGLVVAFLSQGLGPPAWQSALAGVCGVFVYVTISRLWSEREGALQREAALRATLGRVLVVQERARISRDLHDSVATELTALVWNVRELSGRSAGSPYTTDLTNVAERLRAVIGDVRKVVLDLRDSELTFPDFELIVERRCRDLCGPANLRVDIQGRVDETEGLRLLHDHVLPICSELVSNAARHAAARRIVLSLQIGARLRVEVSDDGRGLTASDWEHTQGGLFGVRGRVRKLGGTMTLHRVEHGTSWVIELPLTRRAESSSN